MNQTGLPTGAEFFNLLFDNDEFNSELGRVVLAAGRLESELKLLFHRNQVKGNYNNAALGRLINIGKEEKFFNENLIIALGMLGMICKQRNYLMHNIHSLLIHSIEETILEGRNLINWDVITYRERAWQLRDNLTRLADLIKEK